ncbi:MAG: hypothetical protein IJT21_11080 [Synergistaceae bacterium]|nr:hypothetical protein [Synergistaceae bacterium]
MKKFALLLVIIIFSVSTAFADITPDQAKSDQRFGPYVEFTKTDGAKLLSGRYAEAREFPQLNGGEKILAPSNLVLEIGSFSMTNASYSGNMDVYGQNSNPVVITLDTSGEVPILRIATPEGLTLTEDFAVVMSDGNKHLWCLGSVKTGEVRYLYPLKDEWFPSNWFNGAWEGSEGRNLVFEDSRYYINNKLAGTFMPIDDRITINVLDGNKGVIFAMLNQETNSLVITFTKDLEGLEEFQAEIFKRKNTLPPAPAPVPTPAPAPTQSVNIYGKWSAVVDNSQWVLQYDRDNNYYGWINGIPAETGVYQLNGNTLTGRNSQGVEFTANVDITQSGNILIMTFPNGNRIMYQRMQ